MLKRRFILTAAFLAPLAALAHQGHDLSGIEAQAIASAPNGAGLGVTLRLKNAGDAVVELQAAYSDIGDVLLAAPPVLQPGAVTETTVYIAAKDWPGIFTLMLDFGAAGLGPVTVIPS
ncbi:hypothetical protein AIOL_003061 [Candidatus Rhodobacter oscarellae]|uniref:Copper metallochaperone n=1 Tax=Candidatus Rhodobacter oscarellae TaxID=1675527 RepID=A0A0J9E605_9RHOB|nr:hypothetical protein [Candidatus Rhodobacter lobularis]KMW58091.1 hypothetical protein AIOL_003061 [Candidatus Rhodobacter lobularis]